MMIGDLPPGEAIKRLSEAGLVVRMGPFLVRVRSRIPHFCR